MRASLTLGPRTATQAVRGTKGKASTESEILERGSSVGFEEGLSQGIANNGRYPRQRRRMAYEPGEDMDQMTNHPVIASRSSAIPRVHAASGLGTRVHQTASVINEGGKRRASPPD